jgi:hypothetical protein
MDIAMKIAISTEPFHFLKDLFKTEIESSSKNEGTESSQVSSDFSSADLCDFGSTTLSDFSSQDWSSHEVSDFTSDDEGEDSSYNLSDFSSQDLFEFSSQQLSDSISRQLANSSSQELKDYAFQKLHDSSSEDISESENLVTQRNYCVCHEDDAFMEISDPDVKKYRWALADHKDWFRFNLDPFYPFYKVLEPPLPQASLNSSVTEVEINGNQFEETKDKVPEGIRSILKMLKEFDEEECRNL